MGHDPIRYFMQQPDNYRKDNLMVSLAFSDNQEQIVGFTTDLPVIKGIMLNDFQKMIIEAIFIKLHTVLLNNDVIDLALCPVRQQNYHAGPAFLSKVAMEDTTFLRRAFTSLCCGERLEDLRFDTSDFIKRKNMTYTVTDIACFLNSKRPRLFQEAMMEVLKICNVPDKATEYLKLFGICGNRQCSLIKDVAKAQNKIKNKGMYSKVRKNKWGLFILVYDNIGFRVRGAQAGYDQFVLVHIIAIPEKRVKEVGFYATSAEARLSRTRKEWKDIRSRYTAKDLMANEGDYENLSTRALDIIEWILENDDCFPTYEEALRIREEASKRTDMKAARMKKIKVEFNSRSDTAESETLVSQEVPANEAGQIEMEEDGRTDINEGLPEDARPPKLTIFDRNHVEHEIPLHAYLNAKQTCLDIFTMSDNYRKVALEGETDGMSEEEIKIQHEKEIREHGGEEPVNAMGANSAGNGSPMHQYLMLCDAFQTHRKQRIPWNLSLDFSTIFNHNGPLHTMMSIQQCRGAIFGPTHLDAMMDPYRPGIKAKEYVNNPSDPTQALQEMYQTDAAILLKMKDEAAVCSGNDKLCALDVWNHGMMAAKEDDNELLILMEIKLHLIIGMITDSEKTARPNETKGLKSNPDLYRSAMRLSLIILAFRNRFKYVRIVSEFLVRWECMSEADRVLYEYFMFTVETGSGKPIFIDRFVEWTVMEVRDVLGKHSVGKRMQTALTTLVLFLKERKKAKVEMEHNSNRDDHKVKTTAETDLNYVFIETYIFANEVNLFSLGADRKYLKKKTASLKKESGLMSADGRDDLNPDIISLPDIAEAAAERYLDEFYIKGELNQEHRPSAKVNMTAIPILYAEKQATEEQQLRWAQGTDAKDLEPMTKTDIIENYLFLRNTYIDIEFAMIRKSSGKKLWVAHLSNLRKKIKESVEEVNSFIPLGQSISTIERTPQERREDALKHSFLKLSESVKNIERYKKEYKVRRGVVQPGNTGTQQHVNNAMTNGDGGDERPSVEDSQLTSIT